MQRVVPVLRKYAGLVAGACVGITLGLGVFGIGLGGLIGFLLHELIGTRILIRRGQRFIENPDSVGFLDRRTKHILCIYGLAVGAKASDRDGQSSLTVADRVMLKTCTGEFIGFERREEHLYAQIGDEVSEIDVDGLCRIYAADSEDAEREGVVSFLYRIARGESETLSPQQDEYVRRVSEELGISPCRFNAIRRAVLPLDVEAYAILGISPDAGEEEIRTVYRRLASDFHPDHGIDLEDHQQRTTEEAFVRIQNAYKRIMAERNGRRKTDPQQTG